MGVTSNQNCIKKVRRFYLHKKVVLKPLPKGFLEIANNVFILTGHKFRKYQKTVDLL